MLCIYVGATPGTRLQASISGVIAFSLLQNEAKILIIFVSLTTAESRLVPNFLSTS